MATLQLPIQIRHSNAAAAAVTTAAAAAVVTTADRVQIHGATYGGVGIGALQ